MKYNADDVKKAKELENIKSNLLAKFQRAERELLERENAKVFENIVEARDSENALNWTQPPPVVMTPENLSVSKAKQIEQMEEEVRNKFFVAQNRKLDLTRENEQKYEPITRALKEIQVKNVVKPTRKQIVKFRPRISSTPSARSVFSDYEEASRLFPADDDDEVDPREKMNESVKKIMDSKVINIGMVASQHLPNLKDKQFGIWFDDESNKFYIGSETVEFDGDDIILTETNKKYKGTEGLWKLLTISSPLKEISYTPEDFKAYREILLTTNSLYQRNDPNTGCPKANRGTKWKFLVKPIWDEYIKCPPASSTSVDPSGKGLKLYSNDPVEYRYINNLAELIKRLQYIQSQEEAGNNNFHNEKLSVVQFLHDRLEELVAYPRGLKYLIRCMSALPERAIEGAGLLNDIINKLPFELHAPKNWNFDTYNFCGPGTKLKERLARNDAGINPLDEACKEHDIWYSKYKNPEDRWPADKILQEKAWQRVTAPDADLNERIVGVATTGGMWLKRKLGLGLGTSGAIYPE